VGALAVALSLVWLVLTPHDLYPRFLVWLTPAVALLAAAAIHRSRFALPLAVVAAAAMIGVDGPRWTVNSLPSAQAAELVDDAQQMGGRACLLPNIRGALMAYAASAPEITTPRQLGRCDLSLATPFDSRLLLQDARSSFPYHWTLPAETPYLVYSRLPRRTIS
jgi:hypothetical protein